MTVALLALSFLLTWLIFPMVVKMVSRAGFVRPNYRNEDIPVATGFIFVLISLISIMVIYLSGYLKAQNTLIFLLAISGMSFLGLMDDFLGSRNASGLKGHFIKLVRDHEITTGAIKAIFGGIMALLISIIVQTDKHQSLDWSIILINTLIIALATNSVNLLDLRPGRAAKGFFLGALILAIFGYNKTEINYLYVILGCVLAYIPYDLKAQVMMGDAGSNVLGITLGLTSVWVLNYNAKISLLIFLLLFHLLTERFSLTAIIEKNSLLKFFDMLGRK